MLSGRSPVRLRYSPQEIAYMVCLKVIERPVGFRARSPVRLRYSEIKVYTRMPIYFSVTLLIILTTLFKSSVAKLDPLGKHSPLLNSSLEKELPKKRALEKMG